MWIMKMCALNINSARYGSTVNYYTMTKLKKKYSLKETTHKQNDPKNSFYISAQLHLYLSSTFLPLLCAYSNTRFSNPFPQSIPSHRYPGRIEYQFSFQNEPLYTFLLFLLPPPPPLVDAMGSPSLTTFFFHSSISSFPMVRAKADNLSFPLCVCSSAIVSFCTAPMFLYFCFPLSCRIRGRSKCRLYLHRLFLTNIPNTHHRRVWSQRHRRTQPLLPSTQDLSEPFGIQTVPRLRRFRRCFGDQGSGGAVGRGGMGGGCGQVACGHGKVPVGDGGFSCR